MVDRPGAPTQWSKSRPDEQMRKIAVLANELQKGLGNNNRKVELGVSPAVSTEVVIEFVSESSVAMLSPQNQAAAADFSSTYAVPTKGKVTIYHVSSSNNRIFGLVVHG